MVLVVNVITQTWGQVMGEIDKPLRLPTAGGSRFHFPAFLLLYGISTFYHRGSYPLQSHALGRIVLLGLLYHSLLSFKIDFWASAGDGQIEFIRTTGSSGQVQDVTDPGLGGTLRLAVVPPDPGVNDNG